MPDSQFTIRAAMDASDAVRKSEQLDKKLGDVRKTTESSGKAAAQTGKEFANFLGVSTGKVEQFSSSLLKIGAGGAALGALVAVGAAAFKVGTEFEQATKTIRTGTGATGDALKSLEGSLRNVASTADESIGEIAQVIADLNTRTGQTGPGLEKLANQILDLSDVTGTDLKANVAAITRLFGDWSIAVSQQSDAMDFLFKVSQSTGVEVTKLSNTVVQFGAPLRQLGFDFEQSAALIGKFEKEGVNVETVMSGLRIGLANLAKAGVDGKQGMDLAVEGIKNAGSTAEANSIAIAIFGQRAGPDMAAAVREGRFEIDEMVKSLKNSDETIEGAAEASKTLGDRWGELVNNVKLLLEPLGTLLVGALNAVLKAMNEIAGPAIRGLLDGFNAIKTAFFDTSAQTERFGEATGELPKKFTDAREAGQKAFAAYKELEERTKGAAEGTRELTKEQEKLVGAFNKIDIRKIKDFNEAFGLADKLGKAADFIDAFNKNVKATGDVTASTGPKLKNLGDLMDRIKHSGDDAGESVKNFAAFAQEVTRQADQMAAEWNRTNEAQQRNAAVIEEVSGKMEVLNAKLRQQRAEMTASEQALDRFADRLLGFALATTDLGTTMGQFGREGLEALAKLPPGFDKIKTAAAGVDNTLQQVSTAVTDLGKSVVDLIFNGGKLVDVFADFGKTLLRIIAENALGVLIQQLGGLLKMVPQLAGIGAIFSGTAGAAGGGRGGVGGLFGLGAGAGDLRSLFGIGGGGISGLAGIEGVEGVGTSFGSVLGSTGAGLAGLGLAGAGLVRGGKLGFGMAVGGGALAGFAFGGPVGAAIGAIAGGVAATFRSLGKDAVEKFAEEFARDFGNIQIPKATVDQFLGRLGIDKKILEPIRKDIASSPLFLEIGFQAAEAQGKVEQFLSSLESVGTVFGSGDFRSAFEFGQLTGDFTALNEKFTELFSNSTELVRVFGDDLKPLLIDMGAGFEPLTARIQAMTDAGASLAEIFGALGPEIVLFLDAAQQTGLALDPLVTQFQALADETADFTDRQIALYLALKQVQAVPAQVGVALEQLGSDIEFLLSVGASSDEVFNLLGDSMENLVAQAEKLGIEIPPVVRSFYDMGHAVEDTAEEMEEFGQAATSMASALGLVGEAADSFAAGFDSVFADAERDRGSVNALAGEFRGLAELMVSNGVDAVEANRRAWSRLGTEIVGAYNDFVFLGASIPDVLQGLIDLGVAAGLIRIDISGLAQDISKVTENLRVYNGVWSEIPDRGPAPGIDPELAGQLTPGAPAPPRTPVFNPLNPFNPFSGLPEPPLPPGGPGRARGVPQFQTGGIMPWTGLAWLHGGERVLTPEQSRNYSQVNHNGGNRVNVNVTVNAGSGNPHDIGRAVAREVSRQVDDSLKLNRGGLRSGVKKVR